MPDDVAVLVAKVCDHFGRMFGAAGARAFYAALCGELGLDEVRSADDLYRFGDALCARSSDVATAGHCLKTQALLRGARPS